MKIVLSALLILLAHICQAQKFSSDLCNNLKIISNDAKNSYQNVVKKYNGNDKDGTYFISEPEIGTDVYAVNTTKGTAFFYREFNDNETAQKFLNDVLEPILKKCYGDKNWEFDMSDFSRVWTLTSPKPGYDYKLRLCTRSSGSRIFITSIFSFNPKK